MEKVALTNIVLIGIICLISYIAFRNRRLLDLFMFKSNRIIEYKEYHRIISSAFIHSNIPHLVFNCYSLYSFVSLIEYIYGGSFFLIIFLSSVIGGALLSLIIHRNHEYSALGASGGVCGIIFSSIFLIPNSSIGMFFIPLAIPSYVYAILFLGISIYGIRTNHDNIGHDAHLGGAIIGLLVTTVLKPDIVKQNMYLYATVICISVMFFYYLYTTKGMNIPFSFYFFRNISNYISQKKHKKRGIQMEKQNELIDDILRKISKTGMESLTERERKILHKASEKIRNSKKDKN